MTPSPDLPTPAQTPQQRDRVAAIQLAEEPSAGGAPLHSKQDSSASPISHPPFSQAVRLWFKLGLISFGGPAGQIATMHKLLVDDNRWFSERQFMQGLNYCMLLPGPEAQQLATYLGWRLHGAKGGIAAGALFVLPSMLVLWGLSWLFMAGGNLPWLAAIFQALAAAALAVVAQAILRIGRKSLKSAALLLIAVLSFVLIHFGNVSFLWIILGAALLGYAGNLWLPRQFPAGGGHGPGHGAKQAQTLVLPPAPPASWQRTFLILAVGLTLWWGPVFALAGIFGWSSLPAQQGLFFSQAALVTFGGAYAVLPYVAQQAVDNYGWLTPDQMLAGLALAETTPGPLIMVLQFVGFVGGWRQPGELSPLAMGTICGLITTWVTFLPSFIMIFLGAPHLEQLDQKPRLNAALTAITAAVVGVILNLAVKFGQGTLLPEGEFAWGEALLTVGAFLALQSGRVGLIAVILGCGALGWAGWLIWG
ncbi:MAG: chromate efflux transporter [Pirellulales bacterium]|nr:chromate efflux transporter [Pirellulales bacterium]